MGIRADEKTARVLAALEHRETDRVPLGEFFWTNFLRRCSRELPVDDAFDPYRYWDLDLVVVNPNMDPHLTGIQVLESTPDRITVKTGFGATIQRCGSLPMPAYLDFETTSLEQMAAFAFDDPRDERRFTAALDDQINAVGDDLNLGLPAWLDRVNSYADDFCVFGGICEPYELIWRMLGTENVLVKMAEAPAEVAAFIEKIGDFLVGIVEGQIAAAEGKLSGLYVWGDVAYDHGMFFSPAYWRAVYKPQLQRICDTVHKAGLKVIYHGCGDARVVFEDMIEAGVDCYNPLEAKAGLDVVQLSRQYGQRLAFCGNLDVTVLATNDEAKVRAEVLRKLNAARGGGYIPQSDHSMPDNVSPATYDLVVRLVREYGVYPLELGEFAEGA